MSRKWYKISLYMADWFQYCWLYFPGTDWPSTRLHLADDCRLISDSDRRKLRSSDIRTCHPSTRFGDISFSAAGLAVWNSLPPASRSELDFWPFQTRTEDASVYIAGVWWNLRRQVTIDFWRYIMYVCMYRPLIQSNMWPIELCHRKWHIVRPSMSLQLLLSFFLLPRWLSWISVRRCLAYISGL